MAWVCLGGADSDAFRSDMAAEGSESEGLYSGEYNGSLEGSTKHGQQVFRIKYIDLSRVFLGE